MTPPAPAFRNHYMRLDRARGATIRALAARYGLSRAQAHRIVAGVEILPPPPRAVLVSAPGGGFAVHFTPGPPPRAYRVRHGRRVAT